MYAIRSYYENIGTELEGRVLIVDSRGIVQVDSFSILNGYKLDQSEVVQVLSDAKDAGFGFHLLEGTSERRSLYSTSWWGSLQRLIGKSKEGYEWVMYCAVPIVSASQIKGSLVLSVSIENIVEQIALIRWQMLVRITSYNVCYTKLLRMIFMKTLL